jgi:CO dehydrogenase/acetyl-CoA synthase gamma subunit (corrinoid Fe-S protein)
MAFALRMVNDEVEWKECPLLLTEELEGKRIKLMVVFPDSD